MLMRLVMLMLLCYAVLCCVVLCSAMLRDANETADANAQLCKCYAMLGLATLCYAMLCEAMLCDRTVIYSLTPLTPERAREARE